MSERGRLGGLGEAQRRGALFALVAAGASACVEVPAPGDFGELRYAGNVKGETPLSLLPPISDRHGNAYVLYGSRAPEEPRLFVGHHGGGWSGGCTLTAGTAFGVHGMVGRGRDRAWYWSGDALVGASGATGGCNAVLPNDPSSGSALSFRAVVPWVRETPSRTTTIAWLQAPTDPVPFQAVIDLDAEVYTSLEAFSPANASQITVLGVGADAVENEAVVLVRYELNGATVVEARFIDSAGNELAETRVPGLELLPAYGVRGYLQRAPSGLFAGLDVEGQLVVVDHDAGARRTLPAGLEPVGVHRWNDELFVVGVAEGLPALARIDDKGEVGKLRAWEASLDAVKDLGGAIVVIDDRSLPSQETTWKGPRTAMERFPFLHEHRLDHHADDTTSWLVAGPSFSAGGESRTAIAFAPVGLAYE